MSSLSLITPDDVTRTYMRLRARAGQPIPIVCLDPIQHSQDDPYCGDDFDPTCPCRDGERAADLGYRSASCRVAQEDDPNMDYRVSPPVRAYPPREVTDIERLSWGV